MVSVDLIKTIRAQYRLDWRGIHGVTHWARVLENGLRLAELTGASVPVVWHFAIFHDARRVNDDWDPEHGLRGAEFARTLRGTSFELSDEEFDLLCAACADHNKGFTEADVTIQTCWDADRLDLGRVGIKPNPIRLCTEAAKTPETIDWAYARSINRWEPTIVSQEWDAG